MPIPRARQLRFGSAAAGTKRQCCVGRAIVEDHGAWLAFLVGVVCAEMSDDAGIWVGELSTIVKHVCFWPAGERTTRRKKDHNRQRT